MSSLARRSLRTTAAAAGIAALGVSIAAPAFAAPELPAAPGTDALSAPAVPDLGQAGSVLGGGLPIAPDQVADLPQVFTFERPTFNTAGPELPELPGVPALPEAPSGEGVINPDSDVESDEAVSADSPGALGALPGVASAQTLTDLVQKAPTGATQFG